ncbi:hypothetical protein FRC00_005184 [Tulasnella sp. 408]|nr:hypothetical protein FRC00_005184 [Tulasnella sp. 408]
MELPALEYLTLDFWDPQDTGSVIRPIPLPKAAGMLRSISLVQLRPILPSATIRQLQHISLSWLTLENWRLEQFWNILAQAEQLETLELVGRGTTDVVRSELPTRNQEQRAAVTPRLRRLTLGGLDSGLMAHLLLGIEAPNLVEVSLLILGFRDNRSARYPWLDGTAIHSIPSVSILDISFPSPIGPDISVGAPFPKFLRNIFPGIEHLALSHYSASTLLPFWTDMRENGKALPYASCWPLLRRLTVSGSHESNDWMCLDNLAICGGFLTMRASISLPALKDFSIDLSEAREGPEYEPYMDNVRRLVKKLAS